MNTTPQSDDAQEYLAVDNAAGWKQRAERLEATLADRDKRIGEVRTYIDGLRGDGLETRADDFGRALRWIDAALSSTAHEKE